MRIFLIALAVVVPSAASAQMMQPGQWEITSTITSIKGGNMPPNVAAMMKGRPTVIRHCVTPAEAAQGPREMMKANRSCKFDRFLMAGGRYASQMTCNNGGTKISANATGSYTPVSMAATGTTVISGRMAMTMTSVVKGRRVGACK
jgi:hypothetical protein